MKKVTLKDIASVIGVSTMTVSKALCDKPDVSPELKNKIIAIAKQMGYLKRENIPTVLNFVFVITDRFFFETDQFYPVIYQSVSRKCRESNCNLSLEIIHRELERDLIIPECISNKSVQGIFMVGEVSEEYISKILSYSIPTIFVDFYNEEFPDICSILTDNVTASYRITKYLISLGHTRFAIIGDPDFSSSIRDRYKGFNTALKDFKIPAQPLYFRSPDELLNLLAADMPTAIFSTSDGVANLAVKNLISLGYRIPDDISVAGFDNISISKLGLKELTTVDVDKVKMGQISFDTLFEMVAHNKKFDNVLLDSEVIVRDSTWTCVPK